MNFFSAGAAPLLIVLGQSNAHAHATRLAPADEIRRPLRNVHGLLRRDNQAFGLDHVTWSGFQSFGMNLGETQDHTCSMAVSFARSWQQRIDRGEALPDLYIIEISIGAQGVNATDVEPDWKLDMWTPDRRPVLIPGPLGTADISLYPLTLEILHLAVQSLRDMGKQPRILGLHWNQWETEVHFGPEAVRKAADAYPRIFRGFREALGMDYPLILYRPLSDGYPDREAKADMIRLLEGYEAASPLVRMFDLRQTPFWEPDTFRHGIFLADGIHYRPEIHAQFARWQWELLERGEIG